MCAVYCMKGLRWRPEDSVSGLQTHAVQLPFYLVAILPAVQDVPTAYPYLLLLFTAFQLLAVFHPPLLSPLL